MCHHEIRYTPLAPLKGEIDLARALIFCLPGFIQAVAKKFPPLRGDKGGCNGLRFKKNNLYPTPPRAERKK